VIEPRYRWLLPSDADAPEELLSAGAEHGIGPRAVRLLVARGIATPADLAAFFAPPELGLHDPALLPDAAILVERVARARQRGERVMVFGDFDADGLTGLAILVLALGRLGIDAVPYVPSRLDEGHGLSVAGVDAASAGGATLIVTVDTGSSSAAEVAMAAQRGIDVIVTDHHRVPATPPPAAAFVNPHRPDGRYPDRRLAGSGVAFKVAQLLLADGSGGAGAALDLADLATIGTVSDLAPVLGENRAIARLGLERIRTDPRPGIAALLSRAGIQPETVDLEDVGFALAPRLNAAGRVGEAMDAARLLLASDAASAAALAVTLDEANLTRRDLTRQVLAEARAAASTGAAASSGEVAGRGAAASPGAPLVMVRGPWPVGVLGLVAARLSEESGRPAIVGADMGDHVRASCRGGPGVDLAALLEAASELLLRHGGHAGAAGFEVAADRWTDLQGMLADILATRRPTDARPPLPVDLRLPARAVDYGLVSELARLAPFGPGHPDPVVLIEGLTVARVRTASGGHTQLVLRRRPDVLDAIAFGRDDLADQLSDGDEVRIVARVTSRGFGGVESLQLEVRDVGPALPSPVEAGEPPSVTPRPLQPSGA
jgi:single-stranded-DNA-specific exonuclease